MESIIQNVKDIKSGDRRWLEDAIGCQLKENQKVIIRVIDIDVEPDEESRRKGLAQAEEIAARGRANAAAQGIPEEEIDAALEEATQYVRRNKE